MTAVASFSPLQTLLLFQSLYIHGTDRHSFEKASESLRRGELSDEAARIDLSPESLQDLYLALLKDEAKREVHERLERDEQARGADAPPSSPRKRKIQSPVMPTIEEAKQHAHLIPRMIPRLYANYRARIIDEIRADERTYDILNRELELAQQADQTDTEAAKPSQQEAASHPSLAPAEKASIDAIINHTPAASPAPNNPSNPSQVPPTQPPPPPTSLPAQGQAQPEQRQEQEQQNTQFQLPLPERVLPSQSPAAGHPSPFSKPQQPTQPNSSQQSTLPPPLQEGNLPAASSGSPLVPVSGVEQRAAVHVGQSLPIQRGTPSSVSVQADPASTIPEQIPASPYTQIHSAQESAAAGRGQLAQPVTWQAANQGVQPPPHGYMPPPFQSAAQDLNDTQQPQALAPSASAQLKAPDAATPPRGRAANLGHVTRQGNLPSPLGGPQHLHLQRSDVTISPGSTTAWKVLPFADLKGSPVRRPRSRSISPLSDKEVETKRTPRPGRPPKTRGASNKVVGRARQIRGVSKTPSTAATSTRGRTRSHSTASHGDVSMGDDGRSVATEVATPASFKQENDTDDTRGTRQNRRGAGSGMGTGQGRRKRGYTRKTEEQARSPAATSAPASAGPSFVDEAPADSVVAVRNFSKVSAPILDNIRRHKHAWLFESPVKERDAEGYPDLVYRPQDFKSIRAAISAGQRAVAGALEAMDEEQPGNTVTLAVSEDLVPPKAIVNAAQLEQEVMRLLANAVMYNQGVDEIVSDTREMFVETEQLLRQWRASERVIDDEEDELALSTPADEEQHGVGKRRRLRGGGTDE